MTRSSSIGPSGVLAACTIEGTGRIIVHGKFFEGKSPGIVGPRALEVREHAVVVAAVQQAVDPASFSFEHGSRLRLKVLKSRGELASRRTP